MATPLNRSALRVCLLAFLALGVTRATLAQGTATLNVTPSGRAPAGSTVTVKWSGPNAPGDYITVVRKGAPVFEYLNYQSTSNGREPVNPVSIVLPAEPGAYEIRYVFSKPRGVLATVPFEVTAVVAAIEGPSRVAPGARFEVSWTGPNNGGDWVTIVAAGAAPRAYASYVDARIGRPDSKTGSRTAELRAPAEPGRYELRYVQQGRVVIGTRAIEVAAGSAGNAAGSAVSGGAADNKAAGAGPATGTDNKTAAGSAAAGGAARAGAVDNKAAGAGPASATDNKAAAGSAAAGGAVGAGAVDNKAAGAGPAGATENKTATGGAAAVGAGATDNKSAGGAAGSSPSTTPQLTAIPFIQAAQALPNLQTQPPAPSQTLTKNPTAPASSPPAGTPKELTALAAPGGPPVGGLRVRATSPTLATLHWSCVQGSTGYEVFSAPNGGEPVKITPTPLNPNCVQDLAQVNPAFLAPGSTPVTTYSMEFSQGGIAPGNTYTYFVRALYANGVPADSSSVSVRPLFPAPGFSARPANPGQVSIHWDWSHAGGHYATGYVISRKLAGESAFRQLATIPYSPQNIYNDNGVPVGSHQYLVEAVDGEKGTPVTVTTGAVGIWQAWTQRIVIVDLGFSGVWPGGSVRVLSSPQATGPFTDITTEGSLSSSHWSGVAQFGSNLHYKVVVSYPSGITYESVAQVAVAQASNIGLTAEDAGGGARLQWNCESDVARYDLMRRVGRSGPFSHVGPYAFTVYPTPGKLGGKPTCSYNDTTVPLGNDVEWVVIGFSSKQQGGHAIRAARTSAFIKTWK